ncbi:hypothetical protein G6F57_022364 [Rhizopus arrhizus]|nr:hypothetical protein G6F57_022364 [Rhizopus arrhizus]
MHEPPNTRHGGEHRGRTQIEQHLRGQVQLAPAQVVPGDAEEGKGQAQQTGDHDEARDAVAQADIRLATDQHHAGDQQSQQQHGLQQVVRRRSGKRDNGNQRTQQGDAPVMARFGGHAGCSHACSFHQRPPGD